MASWRVLHRRVEDFKVWKGVKFSALLCDPPYHLQGGFMGADWDKGGIAFNPDTWRLLASHLLPGAFGMAFASARGWHRLACAIEDAGLRIHPSIFGWAYGSGFPKASRLDTQIDRRKGYDPGLTKAVVTYLQSARNVKGLSNKDIDEYFGFHGMAGHWCGFSQPEIPRLAHWPKLKVLLGLDARFDEAIQAHEREIIRTRHDGGKRQVAILGTEPRDFDETLPATDLARAWAGHRYGLQALKPALEPIIVWQKPYSGKAVDSITRTGAGALDIEGGRLGTDRQHKDKCESVVGLGSNRDGSCYGDWRGERESSWSPGGRWPANFALQCACDPTREDKGEHPNESCPVRRLDEQGGKSNSVRGRPRKSAKPGEGYGMTHTGREHSDEGGPSRFFFRSDWNAEVEEGLLTADPAFYCAKAGRKERDAGLEERNPHPTIKALKLCRWLATLLLPPAAYAPRRLLVPFSGAGSEMVGAIQAGWEEVLGVESEREYVEIAEARLRHWMNPLDNADKSG